MVMDLLLVGGAVIAVVGVLELSWRLEGGGPPDPQRPEQVIREAMAGPEAAAVKAEFRGSGIAAPDRQRPTGFLWP